MSTSRTPGIPSRPSSHWPVGIRLRFKLDADLKPQHQHLRGTAVLVLSELRLIGPSEAPNPYSWRQEVLAFGLGCAQGWARPEHLELPADDDGREPDYAARRLPVKTSKLDSSRI